MKDKDKQRLKAVAEDWAKGTISDWLYEYGAWDNLIECDESLTLDEWEYIKDNFVFKVTVKEI